VTPYLRPIVGALLAASLLSGCDKIESLFHKQNQPARWLYLHSRMGVSPCCCLTLPNWSSVTARPW
jgi:hypothetical protein